MAKVWRGAWIFRGMAILSVGVVVAWGYSYGRLSYLDHGRLLVIDDDFDAVFRRLGGYAPYETSGRNTADELSRPSAWYTMRRLIADDPAGHLRHGWGGLEYGSGQVSTAGHVTRIVAVPLWMAGAPLVPLMCILWIAGGIGRRRVAGGRCAACGYDLRGSPTRCPECGTTVRGGGAGGGA